MKLFVFVCMISLAFYVSEASIYGLDVASEMTEEQAKCLATDTKYNFQYIIVRAYRSLGKIDDNAVTTMEYAWDAGFKRVDAYHFPDTHQSPESQINASLTNLREHKAQFTRYWLDIEIFDWPDNTSANVAFIHGMVKELVAQGQTDIGFYSSHRCWPVITGDSHDFSQYDVWYAHYQDPEEPNFDDWVPYGGWTKPFMKQIAGSRTLCNYDVDVDWTPNPYV